MNNKELYILWTNDNPLTAEKMVFMYATNSKLNNWWNEVILYIWGATAKLAAENEMIKQKIKEAKHAGVKIYACKACSDQLGVTDKLVEQDIEVTYLGENLTEILQEDKKLITI